MKESQYEPKLHSLICCAIRFGALHTPALSWAWQGAWEQIQSIRLLLAELSSSPPSDPALNTFCHHRSSVQILHFHSTGAMTIRDSANSKWKNKGKKRNQKPTLTHLLHCSHHFLSLGKNTADSSFAEVFFWFFPSFDLSILSCNFDNWFLFCDTALGWDTTSDSGIS